MNTFTNSSLATARRCLTEYDLSYNLLLELDRDEEKEALAVGTAWDKMHDERAAGRDPFAAAREHAPGVLWAEKLCRLFSAHQWYWQAQKLDEFGGHQTFRVELHGVAYEGEIDGQLRVADGRKGLIERKTTSDSLEAESLYWHKLRLDTQVGLYAIALEERPDFILYDVVRKPTIDPKRIEKKDLERMRGELAKKKVATYFGEEFSERELAAALAEGRETVGLYGARLTADVGNRPEFYFARREVPRTEDDYDRLVENIDQQATLISIAEREGLMHRNPDACALFGICRFFALCSNGIRPRTMADPIPKGYRRREHRHPELAHPDPK